jgi:putative nucleotidyltransferase with HDIG domain
MRNCPSIFKASDPRSSVEMPARWQFDATSESIASIREQLRGTDAESTRALVAAVDARDTYTRAHSVSVAAYAELIARRLSWSGGQLASLRQAALLHDVGKIGVPDAILTKPGPLNAEEFAVIRRHPAIALEILGHLSFLAAELPLILHHHERFDGRGYPAGLSTTRIPAGARILAVADALDTMLSPRTYKPAYSADHVRAELIEGAGSQFDPAVVEAAFPLLDEITARSTDLGE